MTILEEIMKCNAEVGDIIVVKNKNNPYIPFYFTIKPNNSEVKYLACNQPEELTLYWLGCLLNTDIKDVRVERGRRSCPFCGEEDELNILHEKGTYQVYCQECGARGPEASKINEAIRLWNEA